MLGDQRRAADGPPRVINLPGLLQHKLAFTVVTEAARLDHEGQTEGVGGLRKLFPTVDGAIARQRNRKAIEQLFLVQPVLRVTQCFGGRIDRDLALDLVQRFDRHVLEFVGNHVTGCGQFRQRLVVIERPLDDLPACRGGRPIARIDESASDAEIACRETEHLAQLAGADNADTHDLPARVAVAQHRLGLVAAEAVQRHRNRVVVVCENRGGEQGGVDGPGTANRHAADRHARRHLGDR